MQKGADFGSRDSGFAEGESDSRRRTDILVEDL